MQSARYPHFLHSARCSRLAIIRMFPIVCLMLSACAAGQDLAGLRSAQKLLSEANAAFEQRDYKTAGTKALEAGQLVNRSPGMLQRSAELLYLSGRSADSLPLFDRVNELAPEAAAGNWQRGIALCSCGKFAEGAEQFKLHHQVNPDDVENSAWYFLCIAKTKGIAAARAAVIPSRGDVREPMMSILQMLRGKLEPAQVLQAAITNSPEGQARRRAQFYADLYVALYFDSLGDEKQAVKHLKDSLSYGDEGYMVDTARVYLADRFKDAVKEETSQEK